MREELNVSTDKEQIQETNGSDSVSASNSTQLLVDDTGDYQVLAGRWWDDSCSERNCKYSYDFRTLDEAIEALDKVSSYPWSYIEYKGRVLELLHKDFKIFEGN